MSINFAFVLQQREQLVKLRQKLESERDATAKSPPIVEDPECGGTSTPSVSYADSRDDGLIKDQVFLQRKLEEYENLVKHQQEDIRRMLELVDENVRIISHFQEEIGFLKSTMEIQKLFPELDLGREPRFECFETLKPRNGSFES